MRGPAEPDEALLYPPTEEGARGGCLSRGWTPEVLDVGPTTTPRGGGGGGGGSLGGKSGRGCRTPTGLSERVASSMERSQSGTPESACRLVLRRPFMAPTLPASPDAQLKAMQPERDTMSWIPKKWRHSFATTHDGSACNHCREAERRVPVAPRVAERPSGADREHRRDERRSSHATSRDALTAGETRYK